LKIVTDLDPGIPEVMDPSGSGTLLIKPLIKRSHLIENVEEKMGFRSLQKSEEVGVDLAGQRHTVPGRAMTFILLLQCITFSFLGPPQEGKNWNWNNKKNNTQTYIRTGEV
jgi:hypothetical protein